MEATRRKLIITRLIGLALLVYGNTLGRYAIKPLAAFDPLASGTSYKKRAVALPVRGRVS